MTSEQCNETASLYQPNVRVLSCPCTERLQLALRLAHPCAEEIEFTERCCPRLCIAVDGIEPRMLCERTRQRVSQPGRVPLVMLNKADYIVLLCQLDQLDVVSEDLNSRLCHKHMNTTFNSVTGDWVVCAYEYLSTSNQNKRLPTHCRA